MAMKVYYILAIVFTITIISSAHAWWEDVLMPISSIIHGSKEKPISRCGSWGDVLMPISSIIHGSKEKPISRCGSWGDMRETLTDGLATLARLKIDVTKLKEYIPAIEIFNRMLDDCIARQGGVTIRPQEQVKDAAYYDDYNDNYYVEEKVIIAHKNNA